MRLKRRSCLVLAVLLTGLAVATVVVSWDSSSRRDELGRQVERARDAADQDETELARQRTVTEMAAVAECRRVGTVDDCDMAWGRHGNWSECIRRVQVNGEWRSRNCSR